MDTNTQSSSTEGSSGVRLYYCSYCKKDKAVPCIAQSEAIRRKCIPDPNKTRFSCIMNYLYLIKQYLSALFVEVTRYFA